MADRVSDAAQIDHSDADVTYMCVRIESPARRARRVATRDLGRHTPPVVKVKAPAADGMDIFGSVCAVEFFPAYRALSFRSLTGKHPRHLTRRGASITENAPAHHAHGRTRLGLVLLPRVEAFWAIRTRKLVADDNCMDLPTFTTRDHVEPVVPHDHVQCLSTRLFDLHAKKRNGKLLANVSTHALYSRHLSDTDDQDTDGTR